MLKILPHFNGDLPVGNFFSLYSMEEKPITLFGGNPGERRLVCTGLSPALPDELGIAVFSVPALMHCHGISITPFVLTSKSYGEIKVVINNISDETFIVFPGDRIADAVIVSLGE